MLLGPLLLVGCEARPQAPELVDSPVYQNDREGFRFRVPEGWKQTSSSTLPRGDFEGKNFLVRYLVQSPEGGATLQVLCFIDRDSIDLQKYHGDPAFGVSDWTLTTPAESVDLDGRTAERMGYKGSLFGRPMSKEVLCVRRGNRVYSFIGMFVDGDDKAQHAIRRALDSLIWES